MRLSLSCTIKSVLTFSASLCYIVSVGLVRQKKEEGDVIFYLTKGWHLLPFLSYKPRKGQK
jgi:hypothetical protein